MYIPKNQRYTVAAGINGVIYVNDRRTQSTHRHFPTDFVYGQLGYDPNTADYPDYVHGLVWDIVDARNAHI